MCDNFGKIIYFFSSFGLVTCLLQGSTTAKRHDQLATSEAMGKSSLHWIDHWSGGGGGGADQKMLHLMWLRKDQNLEMGPGRGILPSAKEDLSQLKGHVCLSPYNRLSEGGGLRAHRPVYPLCLRPPGAYRFCHPCANQYRS